MRFESCSYGAKGTVIIEKPFCVMVSMGLSDLLLQSVFNALHVQTIITSIERVPGQTLVYSPVRSINYSPRSCSFVSSMVWGDRGLSTFYCVLRYSSRCCQSPLQARLGSIRNRFSPTTKNKCSFSFGKIPAFLEVEASALAQRVSGGFYPSHRCGGLARNHCRKCVSVVQPFISKVIQEYKVELFLHSIIYRRI
jgi:hypothetical protein